MAVFTSLGAGATVVVNMIGFSGLTVSVGSPIKMTSGHHTSNMFSANILFASLVWGSVGLGYFIYGKKQGSWIPMVAGVLMMALSYLVGSALLMSLFCVGLVALVYVLLKRGY